MTGRDDLSAKAARALPRLRLHTRAAERRSEWDALFARREPRCLPFRHRWLHWGLFASHKVCLKCGATR